MPRPKNKEELLHLAEENFEKLLTLIDSLTPEQREAEYLFDNNRDKNVRDIVMHLHFWHLMMLEWYEKGIRGEKPDMPAKGYTWRTIPALNAEIWKKCQDYTLSEALKLLRTTHDRELGIIQGHSDEELFEKRRFKWTGTTSMGSYFISNTSSHYDWAMKLLRKYKKSLKV